MSVLAESLVELGILLELFPSAKHKGVGLKKSLGQLKRALDTSNRRFANVQSEVEERSNYQMEKLGAQPAKINELAAQYQQKIGKRTLVKFDERLALNNKGYLDARLDEMVVNSMNTLLSNSNINKSFKQSIIASSEQNRGVRRQSWVSTPKRQQYMQLVQQYYRFRELHHPVKLLQSLDAASIAPCWATIKAQLGGCEGLLQSGNIIELKEKMRENTIQMLENRFRATMPVELRDFEQAVKQRVLEMGVKVYADSNKCIWAIGYYLLRAGRVGEAWHTLTQSNNPKVQQIGYALKAQYQGTHIRSFEAEWKDYDDMFLKQISHIVNRQAVANTKLYSDIFDLVWMGLQTCQLQPSGNFNNLTLKELQEYTTAQFSKDPKNPKNVQALYLTLNYDALLTNQVMDYDDGVHMALLLHQLSFRYFQLLSVNHTLLTNRIIEFAKQVANDDFGTAVCYINLVDTADHPILMRFLIDNNKIEEFFGLSGQKPVYKSENAPRFDSAEEEKSFIRKLVGEYASTKKKRLSCYKITRQILGQPEEAFQHLLNYQLDGLTGNWVGEQQAIECSTELVAFKRGKDFKNISENSKLLLAFIEESKFLEQALISKDFDGILRIRSSSILFPVQNTQQMSTALEVLSSLKPRGATMALLNFIMLVIQANDFCNSFRRQQRVAYVDATLAIRDNAHSILAKLERMPGLDEETSNTIHSIRDALKMRLSN